MKIRVGFILLLAILIVVSISTQSFALNLSITDDGLVAVNEYGKEDASEAWNEIFSSYKIFVIGFFAIASTTSVLFFISNFITLGASGSNPSERAKAISSLIWTGIATALLGGTMIFFMMSYNLLR